MSKAQVMSMVAAGALVALQGCNDDDGNRKGCGDFTKDGQQACLANGNGKCKWSAKNAPVCEPNDKFHSFFQNEDNCKKYGGNMRYAFKSKCGQYQLQQIKWSEAQQLTGEQEVTFLSIDGSTNLPGYKVDRCVGKISYSGDMNNVNIEVTGGKGACQAGQHTIATEQEFNNLMVLHNTNEESCTSNSCAVSPDLKCVEPGVVCENANQDASKCSSEYCDMKQSGVPTCFTNDKSKMCDTILDNSPPSYCEVDTKAGKQCVLDSAGDKRAGDCVLNAGDANNSTCANVDKTLKGQVTGDDICTYKKAHDDECYGDL